MEKETLNLLIGGGIGFLASFLITVATFIYQSYDRNKKRKWDLEDRRSESRNEVVRKRLDQIEHEAANIIEWANNIFLQYPHYSKEGISQEKLDELTAGYIKNTNLIPNAILLKDRELEDAVTKFGTNSLDLYNWIVEGSLSKNDRNFQEFSDIYDQLRLYYSFVLKCLDGYRMKINY
ncbi:MAG: hypothetical protein CVU41_12220 [Chloroflexi bacterium HGW-Chloroflexi-3]|nr:MAG: hypothetical protein CVU41_12220 [Chloroflexi bacterium HGW-Chloroflexi-3]